MAMIGHQKPQVISTPQAFPVSEILGETRRSLQQGQLLCQVIFMFETKTCRTRSARRAFRSNSSTKGRTDNMVTTPHPADNIRTYHARGIKRQYCLSYRSFAGSIFNQ
jgi:hypothetical protein